VSEPVNIDSHRVEEARKRGAALAVEAAYHQGRADAARFSLALLARTWGFDAGELLDKPSEQA
jgi:hypothetical protein